MTRLTQCCSPRADGREKEERQTKATRLDLVTPRGQETKERERKTELEV